MYCTPLGLETARPDEGKSLRQERVFRLTGHERLDRLPQVFALK